MGTFRRGIEDGAETIALVGGCITLVFAVAMLIYTLLRYIFSYVIPGFFDLGEILLIVMVALPWGYTLLKRGHPSMEIVVTQLRGKPRVITFLIGEILSVAFCGLMTWVIGSRFLVALKTGSFLLNLPGVPKYPFWLAVGIGALFFLVVSLRQTWETFSSISKSTKHQLPEPDNETLG